MRDISIRKKVLGGFGAALAVALAVGIVAYWSAQVVGRHLDAIASSELPLQRAIAEVEGDVRQAHLFLGNLALAQYTEPAFRDQACSGCHGAGALFRDRADAALKGVKAAVDQVTAIPLTPVASQQWPEVRKSMDAWLAEAVQFRSLLGDHSAAQQGGTAGLDTTVAAQWIKVHQAGIPVEESLAKLTEALQAEATASREAAVAAHQREGFANMVVLVVGAAVMALLGLLIGRSIDRSIGTVVAQSTKLSGAAGEGKLDVRGDPLEVPREFRPIIAGINETMEAIAKPVRVAIDGVHRISLGELPPRITDAYQGEFDKVMKAINAVIDVVNLRNADIRHLAESALAGRLDVRADVSKYQGYNGKMVGGLNAMLDAAVAPIRETTEVLERLAHRDLRARVTGEYKGDHARIKDALNATAVALEGALAQVAEGSTRLSAAAGQIASSSEALASGASEQASAIEETAASLQTMGEMVKRSADNAQQANALAQSARSVATEGEGAMQQMTSAMQLIRASAESTSQIIKDINEIAFQTNLLALNAAVEAARAGVAGRGFAVVAEEVRSLALRSKEAANKTEALIRESVRQTGEGDATARLVSEKLARINATVTKVSEIVREIASATQEQTSGIDQVTKAVTQMDHVTQQNAAGAEESSSAASELAQQSAELASLVGSFQLDGASTAQMAPAAGAGMLLGTKRNGVARA